MPVSFTMPPGAAFRLAVEMGLISERERLDLTWCLTSGIPLPERLQPAFRSAIRLMLAPGSRSIH